MGDGVESLAEVEADTIQSNEPGERSGERFPQGHPLRRQRSRPPIHPVPRVTPRPAPRGTDLLRRHAGTLPIVQVILQVPVPNPELQLLQEGFVLHQIQCVEDVESFLQGQDTRPSALLARMLGVPPSHGLRARSPTQLCTPRRQRGCQGRTLHCGTPLPGQFKRYGHTAVSSAVRNEEPAQRWPECSG